MTEPALFDLDLPGVAVPPPLDPDEPATWPHEPVRLTTLADLLRPLLRAGVEPLDVASAVLTVDGETRRTLAGIPDGDPAVVAIAAALEDAPIGGMYDWGMSDAEMRLESAQVAVRALRAYDLAQRGTDAEETARWLAERSDNARFAGDRWRTLLGYEHNVVYAHSEALRTLSSPTGPVVDALDAAKRLLLDYAKQHPGPGPQ